MYRTITTWIFLSLILLPRDGAHASSLHLDSTQNVTPAVCWPSPGELPSGAQAVGQFAEEGTFRESLSSWRYLLTEERVWLYDRRAVAPLTWPWEDPGRRIVGPPEHQEEQGELPTAQALAVTSSASYKLSVTSDTVLHIRRCSLNEPLTDANRTACETLAPSIDLMAILRELDAEPPAGASPHVRSVDVTPAGSSESIYLALHLEASPLRRLLLKVVLGPSPEVLGAWAAPWLSERSLIWLSEGGDADLYVGLADNDRLQAMRLDNESSRASAGPPLLQVQDRCLSGSAAPFDDLSRLQWTPAGAQRGSSLWLGDDAGCIRRAERCPGDQVVAVHEPDWCSHDAAPLAGVALSEQPIGLIAEVEEGLLLISHVPGSRDADDDHIGTYYLNTRMENPAQWTTVPFPYANAMLTPAESEGRSAFMRIAMAHHGASRPPVAALLDKGAINWRHWLLRAPYRATADLTGLPVLAQVTFEDGAALIVQRDPDSRQIVYGGGTSPYAWEPLPGLPQGSIPTALSVSAGAIWALAADQTQAWLLRWTTPTQAPAVWSLADPEGRVTEAAGGRFWLGIDQDDEPTTIGVLSREGDRMTRPIAPQGTWTVLQPPDTPCLPPALSPSLLADGQLICLQLHNEGSQSGPTAPRWTRVADGTRLVPRARGGWAAVSPDHDLLVDPSSGAPLFPFKESDGPPLLLDLSRGSLLIHDEGGLVAQDRQGRRQHVLSSSQGPYGETPDCPTLERRDVQPEGGVLSVSVDRTGRLWIDTWLRFTDSSSGRSPGDPLSLSHFRGPTAPDLRGFSGELLSTLPARLTRPSETGNPEQRVSLECRDVPPSIRTWHVDSQGASVNFSDVVDILDWCTVSVVDVSGAWSMRRSAFIRGPWLGPLMLLVLCLGLFSLVIMGTRAIRFRHLLDLQTAARALSLEGSPFTPGAPVYGPNFFGRKAILQELLLSLNGPATHQIVADRRRIGKTSLLLELCRIMKAGEAPSRYKLHPVYLTMERTEDGRALFRELWRALKDLRERLGEDSWTSIHDPRDEVDYFCLFSQLLEHLHEDHLQHRVVLLLDEFQMLAGANASKAAQRAAQRLRSLTAEPFADRLCWIAAGVNTQLQQGSAGEDSDLLALGPRRSLGPLSEQACVDLVLKLCEGKAVAFSPAAARLLAERTCGDPLLLQRTCTNLYMWALMDTFGGATEASLPGAGRSWYEWAGLLLRGQRSTTGQTCYLEAHQVEFALGQIGGPSDTPLRS